MIKIAIKILAFYFPVAFVRNISSTFAPMHTKNIRKYISLLFMFVFFAKMAVSVIPVFSFLDARIASKVILQLEQETKSEKNDPEKDAFKEKKVFDEHLFAFFHYDPFLVETNYLHNLEHTLLVQLYHPVVPTPPPNV
ncbi:hypothetical protein [Mucilaginibacter sp.]|uniref:hypothetical protein n=1 Tax=Mucilaginibacter sp. TaxID=1882438 RepID=UPI002614A8EF|nr:hypothetical protein [Mucilaginibacter sp.]